MNNGAAFLTMLLLRYLKSTFACEKKLTLRFAKTPVVGFFRVAGFSYFIQGLELKEIGTKYEQSVVFTRYFSHQNILNPRLFSS